MTASLESRVHALIAHNVTFGDEAKITPTADIFDDLGFDSRDIVEVIIGAEEEFGIPAIPDEAYQNVRTVADVVAVVQRAVEKQVRVKS